MPVSAYDKRRASRQSTFNVDIVLWIGQKRSETKPWGHKESLAENGIQHSVNLLLTYPWFTTEYTVSLQDVLVLQCYRW